MEYCSKVMSFKIFLVLYADENTGKYVYQGVVLEIQCVIRKIVGNKLISSFICNAVIIL